MSVQKNYYHIQENINIFRKIGVGIHQKHLKEKSKQLNQICLTAYLMMGIY